MSWGRKFINFCNDNVVALTSVSIIIAIHWGWYKMQDMPALVDPAEKKDLPIVIGAKYLANSAVNEYHRLVIGDEVSQQKTEKK